MIIEIFDLIVTVAFSSFVTAVAILIYTNSRIRLLFRILGEIQYLLDYLSKTYDEDDFVRKTTEALQETIHRFLYRR